MCPQGGFILACDICVIRSVAGKPSQSNTQNLSSVCQHTLYADCYNCKDGTFFLACIFYLSVPPLYLLPFRALLFPLGSEAGSVCLGHSSVLTGLRY